MSTTMKIYYSTDFEGHWPVGTAAVVVAETEERARDLFDQELEAQGLKDDDYTLQQIDPEVEVVHILGDGDY